MSDGIQLSEELITSVINAVGQHDATAQEDRIVVLQYLAAINGFLSADYPGPDNEREELLAYLDEFTRHVCADRVEGHKQQSPQQQSQPAAQPDTPKGRSEPTDDPAVGIWKPE